MQEGAGGDGPRESTPEIGESTCTQDAEQNTIIEFDMI